MTHPNIYDAEFEYDPEDPPGYCGGMVHLSRAVGGEEITVKLFELPPGQMLCPYHYEYVEEWLIVLDGDLELRTPPGTSTVKKGDVVRFPTGPDGAHKLTNRSETTARLIMFLELARAGGRGLSGQRQNRRVGRRGQPDGPRG